MIELSEQQVLDQIADRLSVSYPSVPADAVTGLVREHHARFEGRPIRDFIPLFVERKARAELERIERPTTRV
ncbi:hypothetical protein AU198_17855 [Mycobacterium sp. GA-1199]|uniref:three-helix bundle dimerization domain-containing protein n=1 Tax=Mycobacterium sp. GA-1199 TaxID=1772287 RepID=UPI0007491D71|nr:hypothetical protein [Mycobacterium sp. GA-1199]KUI45467.1 hypothetical protein AU198_17855 [Mycobacterium sp. GA-1199]